MLYGAYLSAAGMARSQQQQDVTANNLANVDTVGFKRDLSVSRQRLLEARGSNSQFLPENLRQATGGAFVDPVYTDFTPGQLQITNRNLDIALTGKGFLTVQDGETVRASRDGRLALVNGKLVRQTDGKAVLDAQGNEIDLSDSMAGDLRIDNQGNVWDKRNLVAKLGVVDFQDPTALVKTGGNLFDFTGQEPQEIDPQIVNGSVEASGVEPTREMVEMLKNMRTFQLNAEMITLQDQTLSRLVTDLPKL